MMMTTQFPSPQPHWATIWRAASILSRTNSNHSFRRFRRTNALMKLKTSEPWRSTPLCVSWPRFNASTLARSLPSPVSWVIVLLLKLILHSPSVLSNGRQANSWQSYKRSGRREATSQCTLSLPSDIQPCWEQHESLTFLTKRRCLCRGSFSVWYTVPLRSTALSLRAIRFLWNTTTRR